jgi:NADH-quinone oxidoreductase subunit N
MIVHGGTGAFGTMIVLLGALFCVFISKDYLQDAGLHNGEVYAMVLFATTGMLGLAVSNDLISFLSASKPCRSVLCFGRIG